MSRAHARTWSHRLWLLMVFVLLFPLLPVAAPAPALAEEELQATPSALAGDGDVASFAIASSALYWAAQEVCIPAMLAQAGDGKEALSRIPTYGGEVRKLYEVAVDTIGGGCDAGQIFRSNLVADQSYVYWVNAANKLVRLSREANVGDAPTTLLNTVFPGAPVGLALSDTAIFVLATSAGKSTIYRVQQSNSSLTTVDALNSSASQLRAADDYVYWISGGCLYRAAAGRGGWVVTALECGGVTSYFPEGERTTCLISFCSTTDYVFIGKGKQVIRHSNGDGAETVVYTSASSNPETFIHAITSDGIRMYLFERRELDCGDLCFPPSDFALYRSGRANDTSAALLHFIPSAISSEEVGQLEYAQVGRVGGYLFWIGAGNVQRLPADAAAIPTINMRVTGIEVTQTIQDLSNSVRLIKGKRTFARVYVESDGADVSGVRATLRATWSGGGAGPIGSVNPGGWLLTVAGSPDRANLDQSFLFELPMDWTTKSGLRLIASLNPQQLPPEPNYGDNSFQVGPLSFSDSPRLEVKFFAWGYELDGTTYYPRYWEDIQQSYGWIRRTYPLASAPPASDSAPGLSPILSYVFDEELGARVDQSAEACEELRVELPDGTVKDDRNKCAGIYVRNKMRAWRTEAGDTRPYFGWTSIESGWFTRGAAGNGVGHSPSGTACCGSGSWDFDGAMTDWYTGHELGHILGRGHPAKNADDPDTDAREGCGHSPDDASYPHAGAKIGGAGGTLMGFDAGYMNLPKAVYPADQWYDMMSYCEPLWISDYTYEGLYDYMVANQANLAAAPEAISGDWLALFGSILPGGPSANIDSLRRLGSVGELPPLVAGPYSIRLFNAQGAQIADHPFTPEADDEGGEMAIAQVVPFAAGARELRIVRVSDGLVLASRAISAQAPTVSSVALVSPASPVSGLATLGWAASDPDGDSLRFDVLYSGDGGLSFQPILFNHSGTSAQIDTGTLAGSAQARFRVIASDGVLLGQADSPTYTVANKPPVPQITAPADGAAVQWGTTVIFQGQAADPQGGYVPDNQLTWKRGGATIGTGASLAVGDLPVGTHTVTLEAENAAGQKASVSISLTVADELEPPGPTLGAGPAQVAWQVPAGSTSAQNAQISIANLGGGSLSWTASESAPWLSLSATSGSAPAVLTLTANPAGIPDGSSLQTTVTISATPPGQPTQTISIPVGLMVGQTYFVGGNAGSVGNRLYLPMLMR